MNSDLSGNIVDSLRSESAGCRISFTWFGTRRALSADQKAQAAETFDAKADTLSASKRIFDIKHPAWKVLTSLRGELTGYWKGITLPYPEPGTRLIRRRDIEAFDSRLGAGCDQLLAAVGDLENAYKQLRTNAREYLGSLYDERDYPKSLTGEFGVTWDYPALEPPEYLREINPKIYEAERQRIAARFNEAVAIAESQFAQEMSRVVNHLAESLAPGDGGQRKLFRDSAVGNIQEFITRFRSISVRSNDQLDSLVSMMEEMVNGVTPNDLRSSADLRTQIREQAEAIGAQLEANVVVAPRRRMMLGAVPNSGDDGIPTAQSA